MGADAVTLPSVAATKDTLYLRVDPALARWVREQADADERSVNQWLTRLLERERAAQERKRRR